MKPDNKEIKTIPAARNDISRVSRTIINNKLMAALDNESGQVAILATKQDLEDLIAALRGYKLADRIRGGKVVVDEIKEGDILTWGDHDKRLEGLAADLEELLKLAFL